MDPSGNWPRLSALELALGSHSVQEEPDTGAPRPAASLLLLMQTYTHMHMHCGFSNWSVTDLIHNFIQ